MLVAPATKLAIVGAGSALGGVGGAETATVVDIVAEPQGFLAVSVYVVVVEGDTDWLGRFVTSPTPWSIDTEFAPVTVQESTADSPLEIDAGSALKALIEGGSLLRRSASASVAEYRAVAVVSLEEEPVDDPPQPAKALRAKAMMTNVARFLSIRWSFLDRVFAEAERDVPGSGVTHARDRTRPRLACAGESARCMRVCGRWALPPLGHGRSPQHEENPDPWTAERGSQGARSGADSGSNQPSDGAPGAATSVGTASYLVRWMISYVCQIPWIVGRICVITRLKRESS
jgi:hypothetical protein